MQVLEFHFNPKAKKDQVFDSFCFEPENIYEKRSGALYVVGLLKNALPQNVYFLDKLAKLIKDNFYKTVSGTPQRSLQEALRKANEFLEKIARAGDVSWLGNLNFGVISLKNFEFNFTKVGALKIFLLRKGQVIDIDKNVKLEDIEPYPLKIFGNIVSGKLIENDVILVLTPEIQDVFSKTNLPQKISEISPFNQRKLKQIFDEKNEDLSKTSGICLLISLSKEVISPKRELFQPPPRIFSFKPIFTPFLKLFRLPKITLKKPKIAIPKKPHLAMPKISFRLPQPKLKIQLALLKKKTTPPLLLILFLILGSFIFGKLEEKQLSAYRLELEEIQESINLAESYLLVAETNPQAEKNASSLLKESFEKISPIANLVSTFPTDFSEEVLGLKNEISERLSQLSHLTIIETPKLIFEFKAAEFVPNKIVAGSQNLYFFSPYSENIFEINQAEEGKILPVAKKISAAGQLTDSILFFSKPNQLINFKEGIFQELNPLETPYSDFNPKDLSVYQLNLYFLDNQKGTIIKYPYWGNFQWGPSQSWLSSSIKNATDFRSMAVDGSAWILTKNNFIQRYYGGLLQETLVLDVFPAPEDFTKIFTSPVLSYLYILEPSQKRIVIINTAGQTIKQFQSEKFDNLLDFTVSEDAKTIYLLNGLKVYSISTQL